jgi:DNA polymerase III subunit epsilon
VTRQVVLDTETTGMDVQAGNRVIEIGCIELLERMPTGRVFHVYLNPDRDSEPGALAVHGLTREFLSDKPRFADIVEDFLAYLGDAELLIHNADFDLGFLDHELKLAGRPLRLGERHAVTDTLKMARQMHPGQRNSLDALCKRYEVDASGRTYHGALLDARLLADVYLAMTAGQGSLELALAPAEGVALEPGAGERIVLPRVAVSADDAERHLARLAQIEKKAGKPALWRQWLGA